MWLQTYYRGYGPSMRFNGASTKQLRKLAEYENDLVFQNIFNTLANIALNLFEWTGLPDTCDERFFEELLLFSGQACIIHDTEMGEEAYLTLPCTQASKMNIYYDHQYYKAYSLGYSKEFMNMTEYNQDLFKQLMMNMDLRPTILQGCVCEDNQLHYPMVFIIEMYAKRIAKTIRAIDVIQSQLKIPKLISTTEESKESIQQAINNIDTNIEAVYVEPSIRKALAESTEIDLSGNSDRLTIMWNSLNNWWSQALTALGVNNLNTSDKKERLLTDEVESNDDFIQLNSAYRLDMRKHFCERMKETFGMELDCAMRHDFSEGETQDGSREGGEVDGNLHNDVPRSTGQ